MNSKKKKSKSKWILWTVILLALLLVSGRLIFAPQNIVGEEAKPTHGDLTTYYSFSGSVEAKNRETLFADKATQIKEINVEEGQSVKQDDTLLTSNSNQKIKAGIDGEVSTIYAEENEQLMPGAKLMDIVDYDHLQISIKVDEYDLAAITEGKEATVTISALSKDVTGTIESISKEGTYTNGVTFFTATIALPADKDIKVGMSAEAKVMNKNVKNALLIPVSYITFDAQNNAFVNVKSDKNMKSVPVEIGLTDGLHAEVLSGITENDTLLAANAKSAGFTPPFGRMRNQETESSSGGN